MEPEKLNYNIRDFTVATCEKKESLLTSVPLDTLTDNGLFKIIKSTISLSYRLQRYEKKTRYQN